MRRRVEKDRSGEDSWRVRPSDCVMYAVKESMIVFVDFGKWVELLGVEEGKRSQGIFRSRRCASAASVAEGLANAPSEGER